MTTPIDWTDACSRLAALRTAYFELLSGRQCWEVEYAANGVTRRVKYSIIDMARLSSEIAAAARECSGAAARPAIGLVNITSTKGYL